MSTAKVKQLERILQVSSATKVGTLLTINTTIPHNLLTGNVIKYVSAYTPQSVVLTVASAPSGSQLTFTVGLNDIYDSFDSSQLVIPYFSTGNTGSFVFNYPLFQTAGLLQYVMAGSGGASFTVSGSCDGVTPILIATVTLPATANSTDFLSIQVPWPYIHINITSIGAASQLKIYRVA